MPRVAAKLRRKATDLERGWKGIDCEVFATERERECNFKTLILTKITR
jgi:hypothetical protein